MYNWFKLFSSNNYITAVAKDSYSDYTKIGQKQHPQYGTSQKWKGTCHIQQTSVITLETGIFYFGE